ncbi:hypothetical protein ATI61_106150 [Archangium gephyra]|uniref:Uncharacterized protein n=1 Tax=Archangium gephyra TaxID=48 RepID=A0AAC8Q0Z1_9BACT|nr:hypothetical protein [Archangium gephyra]AKI98761.1 Hypothetical protein AA314_00388 [Archangium gephyra]REG30681.1 hypothetical protein ATI61_106150 [Archangium gephyra]
MSGEENAKVEWKTPERDQRPVSGWRVSGVIAAALIIFTFFVVGAWAQLQQRQKHLSPAGPSQPQQLGKAELNIVNTGLFQLDTRAEDEKAEQHRRLHGYGWVDRDAGVVHLPIERAIERVVEQRRDGGGR